MKSYQILLSLVFLFLHSSFINAHCINSATTNGMIVEKSSYKIPFKTYEQWIDFLKNLKPFDERDGEFDEAIFRNAYPKRAFEQCKNGDEVEFLKIKYLSDGLKVVGYIVKPKYTEGKKLPTIIFNRGGHQEVGHIVFADIFEFCELACQGFIVLASEYRGNAGGEGKEEFGGADVNDVLNLVPLAKSLGYVDMNNIFMYGISRGGMMTYLAIKEGALINAAAVIGGPTDLKTEDKRRPEMIPIEKELWPDFKKRKEEHYRERSVINWAEKINVPVLILHGGADWRVSPNQSRILAHQLQKLGKDYKLIIYPEDDHTLSLNREDGLRRIIDWFKRHMNT